MRNSVAFQQRSWTQCSSAEIKGQADTIVQPSDGASSGCPSKNGYKSFSKCAESCLVPLLENLPLISWEKAFPGSGNLCLKWGKKKTKQNNKNDVQHFLQVMVSSGCLQNPAVVYAGFYFPGLGIEPKALHMLRPPSATELHPVPKQYAARIWLEAMKTCNRGIVDQALRMLVSLWTYWRSRVREGQRASHLSASFVTHGPPALLPIPIRSDTFLGSADFIT